jgi:pilus assembly protein CpaE
LKSLEQSIMSIVSFIVFSEDDDVAEALGKLLDSASKARVASTVTSEADLAATVKRESQSVLLADLGYAPHVTLDRLAQCTLPQGGLVVCGPREDSEVILRAMKNGAREFLPSSPSEAEIAEMVENLSGTIQQGTGEASEASVIAVIGAKGGVGATLVTCQLAANLQAVGRRAAVVDLNLPLGDVALHFDLTPTYTLADVAKASGEIDEALVGDLLQKHTKSGVEVLAGPSRVEDAELILESHVDAVLQKLRGRLDHIVMDVSRSWSSTCVRALEQADMIVIVALQDVPSLNHARAQRDLLVRLGVNPRKIRTVINRHGKDAGVSQEDLVRFLGAQPDFCIPNDYATSIVSVNEGRPISDVAPDSAIADAFKALALRSFEWMGLPVPESSRDEKSGLRRKLNKYFGKKK